jgi:AhpD family alkylhydroperoxidase
VANEIKELFDKFKNDSAKMKEQIPDTINGFGGLFSKVMKDGALSLREKELVALGIGVAQRCTPCIVAHTKKCLEAGATKEQILEAASVAVVMNGGPAYMHIPVVIDTLEALQS